MSVTPAVEMHLLSTMEQSIHPSYWNSSDSRLLEDLAKHCFLITSVCGRAVAGRILWHEVGPDGLEPGIGLLVRDNHPLQYLPPPEARRRRRGLAVEALNKKDIS